MEYAPADVEYYQHSKLSIVLGYCPSSDHAKSRRGQCSNRFMCLRGQQAFGVALESGRSVRLSVMHCTQTFRSQRPGPLEFRCCALIEADAHFLDNLRSIDIRCVDMRTWRPSPSGLRRSSTRFPMAGRHTLNSTRCQAKGRGCRKRVWWSVVRAQSGGHRQVRRCSLNAPRSM